MNRRSFTQGGLTAVLGTAVGVSDVSGQASPTGSLQYGFPEVASTFGDTIMSLSRGTADASRFDPLLDDLYRSVASGMSQQFGQAAEALKQFGQRASDLAPAVERVAKARGVPEFIEYFERMPPALQQDLLRWQKQSDIVSVRVPKETLVCVGTAFLEQRSCLGPVWKAVLACGLTGLPGLRGGWPGFLTVFSACLLTKVPDLSAELLTDCIGPLKQALEKCPVPSA